MTMMGQYYPLDSPVHRLDSRTKIVLTVLFLMVVFISKTFLGNTISLIFLLFTIFLSKIPIKVIVKVFKGLGFLILFTVFMNIFFNQEGKIFFQFYFLKITSGGIYYSAQIFFRLCIIIVASSMLTFTTQTLDFADGLESLLKPLEKIKFPSHEISMIITIALRFIPTIIEELEKIKKAQISRGADFETGGLIKKVKSFIPLLIPLFVSSFKRADELAMAMEARGYRGDINRTKLKELKRTKLDYYAVSIFVFYTVLILCEANFYT